MTHHRTGMSESDKKLYFAIESMADSPQLEIGILSIKDLNFFRGVLIGLYEKDKAMREIKRLKEHYGIKEEEAK